MRVPGARPPSAAGVSRAHGGCLGTGSRRRTRQAAIVPGEAHTADDPGVSEWGNLGREGVPARGEHIAEGSATGGTETSKYPEERKSSRDPPSSGERKGASPNRRAHRRAGVAPPGLRCARGGAARPPPSHKAAREPNRPGSRAPQG